MGGNASDLLPRFPSQNQTAESAEILYNTLSLGFRLQAVQIKHVVVQFVDTLRFCRETKTKHNRLGDTA
jgi:hypothetical protein